MSRASFTALEAQIYADYRTRGYSIDRALHIAQATAGEIAVRKRRKAAMRPHGRR